MNKNNRGKEKGIKAHKPDMGILMYIIIMSVFGLAMVFDASVFKGLEIFNNQYYFVQQQIGWIVLGAVVGILSYLISYKYLVKISPIGFVILLFLLVFTLIVSKAVNGAKGWIDAGTIFSIQPTEFLKPIFIAFSAFYFSNERKGEQLRKHKFIYLGILVLTIIPILLQPDFGSAMVILAIGVAIYFISEFCSKVNSQKLQNFTGNFIKNIITAGFFQKRRDCFIQNRVNKFRINICNRLKNKIS